MPRHRWLGTTSAILAIGLAVSGCTQQANPIEPSPTTDAELILVQVLDRDEYAVGNALMSGSLITPVPLAADPTAIAYIPASLLVADPTSQEPDAAAPTLTPGVTTLGATPLDPDTLAPKLAAEGAFDLRLAGSWTLDLLAFAGLIDAVGGVFIEVPEAVRLINPQTDTAIVVSAGRQRMGGIIAAEYVTSTLPADFPVDQLQRFRDAWVGVLARLPESPERLRQILTSLGFLARTTVSTDVLLGVLSSGRTTVLDRELDEAFIPVNIIRGGARPAGVLTDAGSRTVATMFAQFRTSSTQASM